MTTLNIENKFYWSIFEVTGVLRVWPISSNIRLEARLNICVIFEKLYRYRCFEYRNSFWKFYNYFYIYLLTTLSPLLRWFWFNSQLIDLFQHKRLVFFYILFNFLEAKFFLECAATLTTGNEERKVASNYFTWGRFYKTFYCLKWTMRQYLQDFTLYDCTYSINKFNITYMFLFTVVS